MNSSPNSEVRDLVKELQKNVAGIFVPSSTEDTLLTVSDWITMPAPIAKAIGAPGLPCGLVTMILGKKDTGKTSMATEALASCQRDGGLAILIDTENKFHLGRAAVMGLDVTSMIVIPAKTIEEAFDKCVETIKYIGAHKIYKNRKVVCVWDSLGATPSEAEMDEDVKDFSMTAAKVIKGRLRKVVRFMKDTKVCFVIINQVYANMNTFGKKTTSYGGSGPEYHSALILELTHKGKVRAAGAAKDADFCAVKSELECVKNHLNQPFRKAELVVDWKGFVVGRDVEQAPEWFLEKKKDEDDIELPTRTKKRTKGDSKAASS